LALEEGLEHVEPQREDDRRVLELALGVDDLRAPFALGLDQLLAERDRLNEDLQKIIDEQTEPWGIKGSTVEIKDVETPRPCSARWLAGPWPPLPTTDDSTPSACSTPTPPRTQRPRWTLVDAGWTPRPPTGAAASADTPRLAGSYQQAL
jgi:hypothetical protein